MSSSSVTSYTNFPSVSQSAVSLTPIIPSTTASLDSTYHPPVASATRFLNAPTPNAGNNGVDMKLALGLGIGLGLTALLVALGAFFVLRHRKAERASFEKRTANLSRHRKAVVDDGEAREEGPQMAQKDVV
ncbi:hypothetical protein BCR35DRAFT_303255 [Leucosporidium creatinivorum]|uniref:Uncharacterized protein n=1 Tax=Leucosporidium creatinivorum TaxID=106004 RepID=A0A1Y2FJM4_9BASI|nr:hypothetical protein BCR35DRAFT_303255 [Leucosporidium creatinivorum]